MTQEDKQLLFKDLCARLPYGVICKISYTFNNETTDWEDVESTCDDIITKINFNTKEVFSDWLSEYSSIDDVKPYLRPLSSMTAEEKEELEKNYVLSNLNFVVYKIHQHKEWYGGDDEECTFSDYLWLIDWLNAHHFDYRGLIEKWLALEAPEGMYK